MSWIRHRVISIYTPFVSETLYEITETQSNHLHCVILITGSQAGTEKAQAIFFPRLRWRRITQGHTRGTGTPCFHGFTKSLFEVKLKEIWCCNNFARAAENQSRSCLYCTWRAVNKEVSEQPGDTKQTGGYRGAREAEEDGEEPWWSRGRASPPGAVTTTRSAAAAADCDCCSNKADSCHKHLLLNITQCWGSDVFAGLLYGALISLGFLPADKAVIALCSLPSTTARPNGDAAWWWWSPPSAPLTSLT